MKRLEIPGKKLTQDELQSIKGGRYPVTGCIRRCTTNRYENPYPAPGDPTQIHSNYVVQHNTCAEALCFPFDTDNGCTCETYVFD